MLKPLQQNIMNGEVLKQYNSLKLDQNATSENLNVNKFPVFVPMPQLEKNAYNQQAAASIKVDTHREVNSNDQNMNHQNRVYYRFNNPDNKILIQVRPNHGDSFKHHFVNIDDIQIKSSNQQFKFDIDKNIFPFDQSHSFLSDAMTSSAVNDYDFDSNHQSDSNGLRLVWPSQNRNNLHMNLTNRPIMTHNGHTEFNQNTEQLLMYKQNDPSQQGANFVYQRFPISQNQNKYGKCRYH